MAPSFLSTIGNGNSALLFEIRLDETNLILRGSEDESTSALVKGTLVLCLTEPLKVQGIIMRLSCESRIGFPGFGPRSNHGMIRQDRELLHEDWSFVDPGKNHTETLPAGNYEYPFEAILPGDAPESVEGLPDTWVIYRMKATVQRGRFAKDLQARKHLRVIRTFDESALELSHAMNVENTWPNKIDYSISTPTKAVIFGTNIQIDFRLVPLLKGLKIGKIEVELLELHEFTVDMVSNYKKQHAYVQTAAKTEWEIPEDTEAEDIHGQEGFEFSRMLPIPKSLRSCRQSAEVVGVKIKHKLKFNVMLNNPDGHTSELRAQLPIHIFISPNLPLNDNNELVNQQTQSVEAMADISRNAPPLYGQHQFDQLYSDLDPSGYMTPSGATTPFYPQSRSGSSENLASLGEASNNAEVSANTLYNRLSGLADPLAIRARERAPGPGATTPQLLSHASPPGSRQPSIAVSAPSGEALAAPISRSSGQARVLSRSNSEDSGGPQHIETSALSRVPSYNTAVHAPARTPCIDDLPTYHDAISRPSTPSPPSRSHSTPALQPMPNNSHESTPNQPGPQSQHPNGRRSTHAHGQFGPAATAQ
ncbi:hypothetical protein MMC13_007050 [Lambiella insularis]|nr:hypothetical protein [Lambiella insularis]